MLGCSQAGPDIVSEQSHRSVVATLFAAVLFCLSLSGCATNDASEGKSPRARSTAGALTGTPIEGAKSIANGIEQISFDSTALTQAAQWSIATEPLTVAGGVDTDPEYDLTEVWSAVLFSDGAVAAMGRGSKILVFAPDGKPERTIGRAGEGPREFRSDGNLFLISGDTLLIVDRGNRRVNSVTRRGDFVRQIHANAPRRPVTQYMRDSAIAVELDRMSGSRGEAGGMVDVNESRRLAREIPFADSLPSFQQFFVSPNGTLWVLGPTVWGDTGWTATAYNKDGAMIGRLQAPGFARVMAFGDDRVLIRVADADGVVSMRVHRIVAATEQQLPGRWEAPSHAENRGEVLLPEG